MLGDKIKRIRKEKGITQKELSIKTGISISYIQQLEYNKKENPSLDILNKIADALNINTNDLITPSATVKNTSNIKNEKSGMKIGNKIKLYREMKKLTQKQLANILNLSVHAISKYEENKRKPKYDMLLKIANTLGINISTLLEGNTIETLKLNEIPTADLIEELNSRDDFPVKISIKERIK